MTRIKLCGLSRMEDIAAANMLLPEYIGFVFAEKSSRFVSPEQAAMLKALLSPKIQAVGVFVNEDPERIAALLNTDVIDLAQLHGSEGPEEMERLKMLSGKPLIKAFQIRSEEDLMAALESPADYILLDSGTGGGKTFNWDLLRNFKRPYFLAGGLSPENVQEAVRRLSPFGVDVSSGIETGGRKDQRKMIEFILAVRKEKQQ